jgi:putative phosphoesterase
MRIAIVSDIHGNRTAFEAVLADLQLTAPDLVLHGGDLADAGSSPAEIVDRVRDLGWHGVAGNTDELLWSPDSLIQFAAVTPAMQPLLAIIQEMAAWTREALGAERLAWLRELPRTQIHGPVALVHASPESVWRAPAPEASDVELKSVYAPLDRDIAIYAHIHRPFIRTISGGVVANTGSVSLPYDGDPRASYLLVDEHTPLIRRVAYDVEKELKILSERKVPHAAWIAKTLTTGSFQLP